ncbi:MAG: nuclear transport factor 2 family protein [Planctomycetota bacterium]
MADHSFLESFSPAIDTMVTDNVIDFLTEECMLQAGNAERIFGKSAIRAVFDNLYGTIQTIHHQIDDHFSVGDKAVYRGTVTYTRRDGSTLTVPFCDVFRIKDEKICEYFIYIDWHELSSSL